VIHEAARQGDVVAVDLFRKAGMYLAIGIVNLWSNTTLLDDVGSVGYVVGTGIDVAERKETEEALYTLSRAVEQSPSTVVITGTEGRIEYANPKFTEIAESLLLAGVRKVDAEMMRLDMASVVVGAQQRLTDMIEEHRAEITLPDAWPVAWGYPPWIEEVWVNYLSNAVRYGGRPPRVELGAKVQPDGMMRFWVRDNGSGLTREEQTRLFTPFTQLDQTRAEGHGPGLSIVRPIVEKLGGQVGVGSEGVPGRGGVFTFTLPSTGAEA
jgi:signal transduction histidine kinase